MEEPRIRLKARIAEIGRQDPTVEMQFSMPDSWAVQLLWRLCRRYGIRALSLTAAASHDDHGARAATFLRRGGLAAEVPRPVPNDFSTALRRRW